MMNEMRPRRDIHHSSFIIFSEGTEPMAIASINPATGEKLREFTPLTDAEIEEKLQLAQDTFNSYRRTSFAERAGWMNRAVEILETEKGEFARLMTMEMGKPVRAAAEEAAVMAAAVDIIKIINTHTTSAIFKSFPFMERIFY